MSRIVNIINDIRVILGDTSKQRWTDDALIRLVNLAISNFNFHTDFLKSRTYIAIEENVAKYDISSIATKILRVQYDTIILPIITTAELDFIDAEWENATATQPSNVLFENLPMGVFKIYPKVEDAISIITQNSPYGGITEVTVTDDIYSIPSSDSLEISVPKFLAIDFIKKPNEVTLTTTDLDMELDSIYDDAIVYYVTGRALRTDRDSNNRAFGNEQFTLYEGILAKANKKESSNNNSAMHKDVPYRGFM